MNIGFIGAGQMAQALAAGFANSDSSISFCVSDPSEDACEAFREKTLDRCQVCATNAQVASASDICFLAVKPQQMENALSDINADSWKPNSVVVSVAAGISIARLAKMTGNHSVIRVMPNTPCLIGAGAMGLAATDSVSSEHCMAVRRLCESVGYVAVVTENQMDAVTGLSGSGPAYIFKMLEAMIRSSVQLGLQMDVAKQLAIQTVLGAAQLAKESDVEPDILRQRVTSPGGTTMEGLKALDEYHFESAIDAAINAAAHRSKELAQ